MIARLSLALLLSSALVVGGVFPPAHAQPQRSAATAPEGKVNINTASKSELMKLKGVGREVAEKIIAYREKNGPFKKPEEIRQVSGVGKGIWDANREAITVK
ncbi:MAG: helix-hairpin-helix domain-containing protein [Candidatus Rokubacteria bacterium]|nr:helix-hairpin-helix domain-containing protein [Candidatus Rokubacteria bacterium]